MPKQPKSKINITIESELIQQMIDECPEIEGIGATNVIRYAVRIACKHQRMMRNSGFQQNQTVETVVTTQTTSEEISIPSTPTIPAPDLKTDGPPDDSEIEYIEPDDWT